MTIIICKCEVFLSFFRCIGIRKFYPKFENGKWVLAPSRQGVALRATEVRNLAKLFALFNDDELDLLFSQLNTKKYQSCDESHK